MHGDLTLTVATKLIDNERCACGFMRVQPKSYPTRRRPARNIQMTQQIVEVAKPLGISVHDHIIVGKEGHASLRGLRLI